MTEDDEILEKAVSRIKIIRAESANLKQKLIESERERTRLLGLLANREEIEKIDDLIKENGRLKSELHNLKQKIEGVLSKCSR